MKIVEGTIISHYCFDAAEEIELGKIETLFGKKAKESKIDYQRITPPYIQYKTSPLLIKLGNFEKKIADIDFSINCHTKIYDFGVITIKFFIPIKDIEWGTLKKINTEILKNQVLEKKAFEYFEKVKEEIKELIILPNKEIEWEDYPVFMVKQFEKSMDAKELLKSIKDIGKVLAGEDLDLSKKEINDATKDPLSYFKDDLTIINWNASFIYDPRASQDIIDIIEFAVIELLELRVYDSVLDKAMEKAYDYIAISKKKKFFAPPASVMRYLEEVKLEVSEVIEKVENSLKLIGDPYLAKVYSMASSKLFLEKWKSAVRKKLDTIDNTYSMIWERASTKRMELLEVMIVVLFVMDIFLFLFELFFK